MWATSVSAKTIKTAELMTTRDQRPYAGVSCMVTLPVTAGVLATVHQHVNQRARREKEIRRTKAQIMYVSRLAVLTRYTTCDRQNQQGFRMKSGLAATKNGD
jgi:hypothetical protein